MVRLFDDGQLSISGASKCLIGIHLRAIVMVLQAVGVAGITQQVAIHHRLVYGVVDMRLVVGPSFAEVPVARTEDVPFADVDGRLVLLLSLLFPV